MNVVILVGNLTKDPETTYLPESQMAVTVFTIAINRGKGKNGEDKGADYPRIKTFSKTAENCEKFLSKGSKVAVQGRIQTSQFKNKEDKTVFATEVIADRVEFLSSKGKSESDDVDADFKQTPGVPEGFQAIDDDGDDIPF